MKFVFCTEPIYQYYRSYLYADDKDKLDKQLMIEYGDYKDFWDLKQQQDALPENIFVAELTARDYPRNPWNYVSQLINKLTYQYLIDSPEFETIFSEVLFNQSEAEFYEFYKVIDRFYNGSEVFIVVGNEECLIVYSNAFVYVFISNGYQICNGSKPLLASSLRYSARCK